MQVMNGGEFDDKDVLVGQAGKTEGFGVTDDPMLMSMLSTGLYANPLRTMLQEIMFNAWDAHRMGNCQDKPIDVYLNETTGLIVRDYGPGIAPKDMRPIYCIYGNSTKRKDDNQTGGFGLGSKSPYAYNDSFTVTSHHDQKKSMYLMKRVSEENNGGPGMTPIIQEVDTSEKGLMVTVPMKNERDIERSYDYIKDIAYLSGIKLNLHLEGEETETIESEFVAPGEWIHSDDDRGNLFAVYGGVRYKIVEDDGYRDEYNFVKKMARLIGTMYIGFAPSTLTPLPNREGLNMSERSIESIKSQLETMQEAFELMLIPAARVMLQEAFKSFNESGIQPHFMGYLWGEVGDIINIKKIVDLNHPFMEAARDRCPESFTQSMWNSLMEVMLDNTKAVMEMVGYEKWNQMLYIIWAKAYPDYRHYKKFMMYDGNRRRNFQNMADIEIPKFCKNVIEAKKLVDTLTGQDVDIRIPKSDGWDVVVNIRGGGKVQRNRRLNERQKDIVKELMKGKDWTPPKTIYDDQLWYKKDGEKFNNTMMHHTIIVSKTLAALKETSFSWQGIFCPKYAGVGRYHGSHKSDFNMSYGDSLRPVPALVVHKKKGGYDSAVKALQDAGWDVIEADEPEVKQRSLPGIDGEAPVKRGPITYPLLSTSVHCWETEDEVENPTCYLYCTPTQLNSYDSPSPSLVNYVKEKTPRLVIIHNKARTTRLENKNVPSLEVKLHDLVMKLLQDEKRLELMMLHNYAYNESEIPRSILTLPEMSKFMGLPYLRTSQKEKFLKDYKFLMDVKEAYRDRCVLYDTKQAVKEKFAEVHDLPSVSLVREMCKKTRLFDKREMKSHIENMKRGEKKVFSEKLMRFMRTV